MGRRKLRIGFFMGVWLLVLALAIPTVARAQQAAGDLAELAVELRDLGVSCETVVAELDSTIGIHPTAAEEFVTMREPWTGG